MSNNEPNWDDGCKVGEECNDCIVQRKHFGYVMVDGAWVKP